MNKYPEEEDILFYLSIINYWLSPLVSDIITIPMKQ